MRIRASAVLIKGDEILMIHRIKEGKEYWVLPGGSVEDDETVEQATLRELKEETSIDAVIKEKIFHHTSEEVETQLFVCEYISGEAKLAEDSIELELMTEDNQFNPVWVDVKKMLHIEIFPHSVKTFLRQYLQ